MQLKKLSTIAILAIANHALLHAENYVTVDFLQYNENDNRVAVSAPSMSLSYDIGTDFTVKVDFVHDAITGATPVWQSANGSTNDTASGASGRRVQVVDNTGDYVYKNQTFNDERNAGSILVTRRFANRDELTVGADYSDESDYRSKTFSADYMHYTDASHNRSINFGISGAFDEILSNTLNATSNNREEREDDDDDKMSYKYDDDDDDYDGGSGASQKETSNTINVQLGINQILNETSSLKVDAFSVLSAGYLTNPHQAVVRNYGTSFQRLSDEIRPDKRVAYGLALKHIMLLGEKTSLSSSYRFYTDDWDINSHTLEEHIYYEATKKLTLGIGARYYTQTQASFYNASKDHFTNEQYASSDERLSQFNATTLKASVDYKISNNISYNIGAENYTQSTGLQALMVTTGVKYNF